MKKIYNIGYIGKGEYKSTSKHYLNWFHILERCWNLWELEKFSQIMLNGLKKIM